MHIDVQPNDFPRLAPELETTVFRIVQEALTNVFRHSGAHKGWVTLAKLENDVIIKVRDDGRGVSEHTVEFRPDSIGIGINGMRQRVKELVASFASRMPIPARCSKSSFPTAPWPPSPEAAIFYSAQVAFPVIPSGAVLAPRLGAR